MRGDLDRIMTERELDWLIAWGPAGCADVHYLARGAKIGHAPYVLKRRGAEPFFVVGSMERDEARAAGLSFATFLDYGSAEVAKAGVSPLEQSRRILLNILDQHGVRGRTAFCGEGPIGWTFPVLRGVLAARPEIELVEEPELPVLAAARATKDAGEIARMRDVARRTEEVVGDVVALLRSCDARGPCLLKPGGAPLKIGEVKDRIGLELARRGLDDRGETIFAAGREAGFPHSRGTDSLVVPSGRTIIFDIFPGEKGGGYHFDFTRTFWLGAVPERVREAYAAVEAAYERAVAAVRPGGLARDADAAACDAFEERGFPTKRKDPRIEIGYCHSIGHGIGLEVHERPHISIREGFDRDRFEPGMAFTIEPGLYFPAEEFGIRIEDTLVLRADGRLENLASFPKMPDLLGDTRD
jgi:Xaa-Pro aminopeptidase